MKVVELYQTYSRVPGLVDRPGEDAVLRAQVSMSSNNLVNWETSLVLERSMAISMFLMPVQRQRSDLEKAIVS